MTRRLIAGFVLALLPVAGEVVTPAASNGTACSSLAALTIPTITIRSATATPAGPFTPPGISNAITLPAFCRVEATGRPTTDSEIKFEVWIPPADAWNGKLEGVGNGGYSGAIGYAGDDMKFGQAHPEKIVDWAYRSVHVMTEAAKLIVRDAQGRFADKAYFVGCSSGGHQ